jgi:Flp pilus assembly protein TadG
MKIEARRLSQSDDGAAVIEFVVLVTLVLIPIVYVVLAVMQVQAASFAVTQAVREAGRAYVQASTVGQARSDAQAAVAVALRDQGFQVRSDTMKINCDSIGCFAPGATVTVDVTVKVRLPFLPDSLAQSTSGSIPVNARHTFAIDTYRSD